MSTEKIIVDTREIAHKMSFLVGKTILFREVVDDMSDSTTAAIVSSVRVENTPGTEGRPCVVIRTSIGVHFVDKSNKFKDIMVLGENGSLNSLGEYAERMGIVF